MIKSAQLIQTTNSWIWAPELDRWVNFFLEFENHENQLHGCFNILGMFRLDWRDQLIVKECLFVLLASRRISDFSLIIYNITNIFIRNRLILKVGAQTLPPINSSWTIKFLSNKHLMWLNFLGCFTSCSSNRMSALCGNWKGYYSFRYTIQYLVA